MNTFADGPAIIWMLVGANLALLVLHIAFRVAYWWAFRSEKKEHGEG